MHAFPIFHIIRFFLSCYTILLVPICKYCYITLMLTSHEWGNCSMENTNSICSPETVMNDSNTNIEGTLPVLFSVLDTKQVIPIIPKGTSMCPFFLGDRDTLYLKRPVFPLKRGDIALYQRKNGTYIVHRIHHVQKNAQMNYYYFLGDNQTWIEGPVSESQIVGVTSYYMRKSKKIDCTSDWRYNLLWRLWMFARPFRPLLNSIFIFCKKILPSKPHSDS